MDLTTYCKNQVHFESKAIASLHERFRLNFFDPVLDEFFSHLPTRFQSRFFYIVTKVLMMGQSARTTVLFLLSIPTILLTFHRQFCNFFPFPIIVQSKRFTTTTCKGRYKRALSESYRQPAPALARSFQLLAALGLS